MAAAYVKAIDVLPPLCHRLRIDSWIEALTTIVIHWGFL
jgi:hypothetical protein